MKVFRISLGCILLVILFSLAAMAQSVQADFDRSFNLASLKTFAFSPQDRKQVEPLAKSPLNDRRIHDALDSQLEAHGFTESGAPDFLITYFVTTQTGFDIQDNRTGIFQKMGALNVNQVTEGTLVVVFTDSSTNREVWRGFVSGIIEPKDLDKNLNKGIAKLVKKFVKNQTGKK